MTAIIIVGDRAKPARAKPVALELPEVSTQRSLERALENIAKAEALDGRPRKGKFLILTGQLYEHSVQS